MSDTLLNITFTLLSLQVKLTFKNLDGVKVTSIFLVTSKIQENTSIECQKLDRTYLNQVWRDIVSRRGPPGANQLRILDYYTEVLFTVPSMLFQVR